MFNHQARWDRELPQEQDQNGEPIAVTCLFDKQKLVPKSFLWRNRELSVQKVNFFWKDKQGRGPLFFFSVQTQAGAYEIVFSPENLSWRLNKCLGP